MARKYLRGLQYVTGNNGRDIPLFMRAAYEFWGYCVHNNPIFQITNATNASPIQITTSTAHGLTTGQIVGISNVLGNTAANGQFIVTVSNATQFTLNSSTGNGTYTGGGNLCVPGGLPITPVSAPAGFFEGTTVVLATGTDGVTSDLGINFTSLSANFNSTMIGKHITIWSHTDPDSTDNSIYRILNVLSPTQLSISPFSGGTKDITTLKNNLTSRSALNYRVLDLVAATQMGVANGNYFVGTLTDGYTVNTGQANPQFQFFVRGASTPFGTMGMVGSPGGTWNGSAFTGSTITEALLTHTNSAFTGTTSGAIGNVTMIGDKDFFLGHIRSPNASSGVYFYVIIPKRIYTQAQDLNPFTIMVGSNNLLSTTAAESHSTKFAMVGNDGTARACQLMTKNLAADGATNSTPSNSLPYTIGPNLSSLLVQQSVAGKVFYSDALISHVATVGQFSLARAKLRNIAFTGSSMPAYHLVGDNGEFIHVANGVLWPWDGSILPYNLLPLGT